MQRAVNNQVGQLLTGSSLNYSMKAKNAQTPNQITFFSKIPTRTTPVLSQATYQHGRMEGREQDYE